MGTRALIAALGALLTAGGTAHGAVIYTESFTTSSNTGHNSINWQAFSYDATAGTVTNNGTSTTGALFVAPSTGFDGSAGIGAKQTNNVAGLVYTSEFGTVALSNLTNLSFNSNNSTDTGGFYRIAIRIDSGNTLADVTDDVWYASEATYTSSGGNASNWTSNASAGVHNLVYTATAAGWRTLTFVPSGGTAQITVGNAGSVTSNLSGTLTAAGLYMNPNTATTIRYDNFQISAVPEPTSLAAMGLGAGLLLLRRRKAR